MSRPFVATHVITEVDCHNCDGTFSVRLDVSKNGNHVVECPNCGHEHCRVIEDGKVTSTRWDSRNGGTFYYQPMARSYTSWTASASTGYYSTRTAYYSSGTSSTDSMPSGWTERRSI